MNEQNVNLRIVMEHELMEQAYSSARNFGCGTYQLFKIWEEYLK